jgi:hypothetical protein
MLLTLSIAFGIFALISAAVTGWALRNAPVGFEDEDGFQAGVQKSAVQATAPRAETLAARSQSVVVDSQENDDVLQVTVSAKRLGTVNQRRGRVSVN